VVKAIPSFCFSLQKMRENQKTNVAALRSGPCCIASPAPARLLGVSIKTVDGAATNGSRNCRRIGCHPRFAKDEAMLEQELAGVSHGAGALAIHLRDGHPRFVIGRERLFIMK
jgi:hypothetical protein